MLSTVIWPWKQPGKLLQTGLHSISTSAVSLSTETAVTAGSRYGSPRIRNRHLRTSTETASGRRRRNFRGCLCGKSLQGTRLAILRLPMIYGPGCKGNYKTLVKMAQKLPLFPTYHNERSVLRIDHLCEYLRTLAESGEGGLFWPQEDTYRSTPDMVFELAQTSGHHMLHAGWMNPFVKMAFYLPGKLGKLARKAFGTLTLPGMPVRKRKKSHWSALLPCPTTVSRRWLIR